MSHDDDDDQPHVHGFGVEIPVEMMAAIAAGHDNRRVRAQDRNNMTMSWLEALDVEGLMAVRWILQVGDGNEAYANNKFFDGIAYQLLRSKGVDPNTGLDPATQLLETEALRAAEKD